MEIFCQKKPNIEIWTRRQGIFFFLVLFFRVFLFKHEYFSLTPCLRTNKVIAPYGYAGFLIWFCLMTVRLKTINGRQLGRDGMLNVVESMETLCQPRACKGKTVTWQRQLNRLVKSGTIKTMIWVLSKHGSRALRNDSCIIHLQIILRVTSGAGWKQFRK